MVDKEICHKCLVKYAKVDVNRTYWKEIERNIWCIADFVYIDENSEIPIDCPYKLEQLLKEDKNEK